jgi:hypothetical protein
MDAPVTGEGGQSVKPRVVGWLVPSLLALLAVGIHALALGNYGYFRDELYYIVCAGRLDWGYVDHPPLSIALLAVIRAVFGDGLWAIRLPAVIAFAGAVFMAAMIARSLGGGRFAQAIAGIALLANPTAMGMASFYSMNAFDLLLWSALAWVLSETLRTGDARGWLLFGFLAGLGLLNKYSVGFLGGALVVAMLLTPYRNQFLRWQLWAGGALALLLFLPHILWQVRAGFPTLEFMYNASHHKNIDLPPHFYLLLQVIEMGPVNVFLWTGGAVWAFWPRQNHSGVEARDARPRLFAMVFLLLLAFHAFSTGSKPYYMATAYTFMLPVGACALEAVTRRWPLRTRVPATALLCMGALVALPLALPILPVERYLEYQDKLGLEPAPAETHHRGLLPQHFGDRFGWPEFAAETERAFNSLSASEQAECVVVVMNYGGAAALEFFGGDRLPRVVCGHNNYFLWRPQDISPQVALVISHDRESLEQIFREVEEVGFIDHPYAMPHETQKPIFRCRGLLVPMEEVWQSLRKFI